jgi:hypothetical protein
MVSDRPQQERKDLQMPAPFAQENTIRKVLPFAPPHPSPSINELVLGPVANDDPVRLLVMEAIKSARVAAEKSRAASVAIHGNSTLPEGARHVQAADVAFKTVRNCLPLMDKARESLQTAIIACKAKTCGPLKDTSISGHMQAAELRQLLASMSGKNRLDTIAKSLAEGDDSLAGAALHASRFLTGLSEIEQEHVRQLWAQKRVPEVVARLKVLESDHEHLYRAGQLLLGFQTKCSDPAILAQAKAHQENARAATAAATGAH